MPSITVVVSHLFSCERTEMERLQLRSQQWGAPIPYCVLSRISALCFSEDFAC